MWIDYSTNEIDNPLSSWLYPVLGYYPYDKKVRLWLTVLQQVYWQCLTPPAAAPLPSAEGGRRQGGA